MDGSPLPHQPVRQNRYRGARSGYGTGKKGCQAIVSSKTRSDRLCCPARLLALPVRRALVEERVHSLAEILAHIGTQYQVPALLARQGATEAEHCFLGGFHRDRRMAGNKLGGF